MNYDFEFEPVRLEWIPVFIDGHEGPPQKTEEDCNVYTDGYCQKHHSRLVVASEGGTGGNTWKEFEGWCKSMQEPPAKILIKAETLFSGDDGDIHIHDGAKMLASTCFPKVDRMKKKVTLPDIQNRLHEIIKDTQADVRFEIRHDVPVYKWQSCWTTLLQWVTFFETVRRGTL